MKASKRTKSAKRASKQKPATASVGGSRTAEARDQQRRQATNQDMAVIARDFMYFCEQVGISRSAVGRILGISHTSMALVTQDINILSDVRKRAAVYNFKVWCNSLDRINKKLKTRVR